MLLLLLLLLLLLADPSLPDPSFGHRSIASSKYSLSIYRLHHPSFLLLFPNPSFIVPLLGPWPTAWVLIHSLLPDQLLLGFLHATTLSAAPWSIDDNIHRTFTCSWSITCSPIHRCQFHHLLADPSLPDPSLARRSIALRSITCSPIHRCRSIARRSIHWL